jgi:hypothetical protein
MSIRYKEKTVKVIDKVCCDVCGINTHHDYADLNAPFDGGFGIQMCETCFKEFISWAKERRHPGIFTEKK